MSSGNYKSKFTSRPLYDFHITHTHTHSLFCVGNQLVVATGYGVLHRLNWEGKFDSSLAIHINQVPFANDLLPETRGEECVCVCVCVCV